MEIEYKNHQKKFVNCANLKEFFAEFTKYRNSRSENAINEGYKEDFFLQEKSWRKRGWLEEINKKTNVCAEWLTNYENETGIIGIRLSLDLTPVDLKDNQWPFQREKIEKVLKEIWETGSADTSALDLNWPTSGKQNGSKKEQEKKAIKKALASPFKKNESGEDAKEKLNSHIGFQREKNKFENYVYLYADIKDGKFRPKKEIICYAGAPGTGKTTFVKTLERATGIPLELISCTGLKESSEYSILGDENKPSLPAWVMKKQGCKNVIILLDEVEKVHDEQIQRDLVELFKLYKNKEGQEKGEIGSKKFFDKYYQMDIELDHILFFATVNYPQDLVPLLKREMEMYRLEDYSDEEKRQILRLKKAEIEKKLQAIYREKKEIIPDQIIQLLPQYIKEGGVRQAERVLYKIEREYVSTKEKGKEFSLGDPREWLKKNVLAYQESFSPNLKHYCLFSLWAIIWILLLVVIINKIILRKERLNE